MNKNYSILVIGSVNSTAETIKGLVRNDLKPVGILGYQPSNKQNVSGWRNLQKLAMQHDIPFKGFKKINDPEYLEWAHTKKPDIIFAVGFSQLLHKKWLDLPSKGCVGFHPTVLPKGRGRAPLAWLILNQEKKGAATFFLMGEGADDGPIFVQKEFEINNNDTVRSVADKVLKNIGLALDTWLPDLKKGVWNPKPQNHENASWYGKRDPNDGIIDWSQSAYDIDRKIRATTRPYPGAFTFLNDEKIIIWSSHIEEKIDYKGVPGKILIIDDDNGILVQCGTGLLWLEEVSVKWNKFKVGIKLGYDTQIEIHNIWEELKKLKNE